MEIRVETVQVGQVVRLRVLDDGEGIAPDARERVFDPFFTTKLTRGGTGLGLSIAHGVVLDHGGEISLTSQPGCGTTIEISLPLLGALDARDGESGSAPA